MLLPKNTSELFKSAEVENLYTKLIEQLNKDFQLSNLNKSFEVTISSNKLILALTNILYDLYTNHYDDYLNLLYRIDVLEKDLLKIKGDDLTNIIEQITFVILKREYQKVWFKSRF